jgi:hypothetical protein
VPAAQAFRANRYQRAAPAARVDASAAVPVTGEPRHTSDAPAPTGSSAIRPRRTSWTVPVPEAGGGVKVSVLLSAAIRRFSASWGNANAVASEGAQSQLSPVPSASASGWIGAGALSSAGETAVPSVPVTRMSSRYQPSSDGSVPLEERLVAPVRG